MNHTGSSTERADQRGYRVEPEPARGRNLAASSPVIRFDCMARPTRWLLAAAVLAAANLPYAAPLLCRIVQPGMATGMQAMVGESGSTVGTSQPAADRCDFAKCSTAPVAPPFALGLAVGSLSLHSCAAVVPAGGHPTWQPPPLPPPPKT